MYGKQDAETTKLCSARWTRGLLRNYSYLNSCFVQQVEKIKLIKTNLNIENYVTKAAS